MSRAEQIQTERRRRDTSAMAGQRKRLAINESKLDRENFTYRWVNDDPARMQQLTVQDDWEPVVDRGHELRAGTASEGAQVAIVAGTGDRGAPIKSVLLRKPKRYHDEDRLRMQRRIDETEAGLRKGAAPGASDDGAMYVPRDGITLRRG